MKEHEKLNIALVGAGPGCKAIIQMFEMDKFRELRASIIGVADTNPEAIGYLYAKEKGFFVTNDYRDFFKMKDLNLIIEVTGSKEVLNEIMRAKPENILVMDHISARLFWDFIRVEEERLRIQRELQKKTEEHKHLFGSIAGYVVVIDEDYRIVQMNENFRKDFGDVRGKHCFTILKGRNQQCMPCPGIIDDEAAIRESLPLWLKEEGGTPTF